MTISADAIGTPISRPNGLFPVVDLKTGCLTEHGLQLWSQMHSFIVGMNRVIPCNASGTNVISLTPLDSSPLIEKYVDHEIYVFAAAATSTGDVTMNVVTRSGALSTLKAYKTGGSAQASTGDVVNGSLYLAIYNDAMDAGAGGFVLK